MIVTVVTLKSDTVVMVTSDGGDGEENNGNDNN